MDKLTELGVQYSGIVAVNTDGLIGVTLSNGKQIIPWHIPEDLANFKRITANSILIMGRKTYESLPRPLDGRLHIVLTNKPDAHNDSIGTSVWFTNMEMLAAHIKAAVHSSRWSNRVFIIGGSAVFKMFEDICDSWYITLVHKTLSDEIYEEKHYFHPPISLFSDKYNMQFSPLMTSRNNIEYEFWVGSGNPSDF